VKESSTAVIDDYSTRVLPKRSLLDMILAGREGDEKVLPG